MQSRGGSNSFHVSSSGQIWSGATEFGNATFKVSSTGQLTATSGTIAGWTIGATSLSSGALDELGNAYLNTEGGAWFSVAVLSPVFAGFGQPSTTGGATNTATTTVVVESQNETRGYLRNISYGATRPSSPVLGDIHFS